MKTKFLIILFIVFIISACKKDKITTGGHDVTDKNECDYNAPDIGFAVIYSDHYQYKSPHFNPNNPNEFVYYYTDNINKLYQLVKYNMISKKKLVLVDNVKIISQPKWSKKGWIAFDKLDHNIWKVKDDGSNLTKVTNNNSNLWPVWNSTGDYLIWRYAETSTTNRHTLKLSLNQIIPDTIYNGGLNYVYDNISEDDKLFHRDVINNIPHLGYFDLQSSNFLLKENFVGVINCDEQGGEGALNGVTWGKTGNSKEVYFTNYFDGLYKIDIEKRSLKKLIDFCETKSYSLISASSNGKYLIGERTNRYFNYDRNSGKPIGEYRNSSIYLIDLNTLEEIKVEL
jgi:hypothetical protein